MQRVSSSAFRWTMDSAGDWLCIQTGKARQIIDGLNPGKVYDIDVKQHREQRSLDSNRYAWALMDKLAAKTRIPKTEIYRSYIREIGGNSTIVCMQDIAVDTFCRKWESKGVGFLAERMQSKIPGCTNVIVYYGSSTYDTAQMSRLIDLIVQDCKEQGIETLPPQKLAALMEAWDAQNDKGDTDTAVGQDGGMG